MKYLRCRLTFLASIICAVYGISPDEINFESFSASKSSLSGSDTTQKLANSKDSGLHPLLSYLENIFSDFIIQEFSGQYVFRWTGLDEEDEDKRHELRKLVLTVNEMRAQEGYDKLTEDWGDAPLNPSLMGAWQGERQQNNQDFGDPGQRGGDDDVPGDAEEGDKKDADAGNAENDNGDEESDSDNQPKDMNKSFGLPVYTFEV